MRRGFAIVLAWALVLGSAGAARGAGKDEIEQARILYTAGAQAYAAGRYGDAVTAFRAAHALTPERPTVLFSLAQAERRHYTVSRDVAVLEAAIKHFRAYLGLVPEGGRRGDAVAALGELEAISASIEQKREVEAVVEARILVTTQTPRAVISIDGVAQDRVPVLGSVEPGEHRIAVKARGFVPEERTIVAVEGAILPVEVNLRELPSSILVAAPVGASIVVDGRSFGAAPIPSRIELPSGAHTVSVTRRGHETHVERVAITPGEERRIDVTLRPTVQRRVSYWMFGGAFATLGVGAMLAVGAGTNQETASELYERATTRNLSEEERGRYTSALIARDAMRAASVGVFGLSAALGAAGAITYWFDDPTTRGARMEVRAAAAPLPGGGYFGLSGRF